MELTAWLSDVVVGDGAVEPLEVGRSYRLALALHRPPPDLAPAEVSRLGWDRWEVDVTGRVALVDQHEHGGAMVLVGPDETAFVVHLAAGHPQVVTGQELTVRAVPYVDPWAWYCGPDFPDSAAYERTWRVVRVQRVTSPVVPMPGGPATTWIGDRARAQLVDLPAVERWPGGDSFEQSVDHLVTLQPDDGQPRVESTSR